MVGSPSGTLKTAATPYPSVPRECLMKPVLTDVSVRAMKAPARGQYTALVAAGAFYAFVIKRFEGAELLTPEELER